MLKNEWGFDPKDFQIYAGEKVVCDLETADWTPDEAIKNAALIVAAPELLAACRLAYQSSTLPKKAHEAVINAIAKAEGK